MKKTLQTYIKQLQKDANSLQAVRWNEGFQQETDEAFANFWEREGESLRNQKISQVDNDGNTLSSTTLGDIIKKPDFDPYVLRAYCRSPEASHVCRRYGLNSTYHYNQPIPSLHLEGYVGEIEGKKGWVSRFPCLRAFRDEELNYLDIKIDLSWPKKEIMAVFEIVLDDALQERDRIGKKTKRRGLAVDEDDFPFKVWVMHKKKGMTSWEITQELFPFTSGKSPRDFDENFSPEARSLLRKVERALKKADELISSITPSI